MKTFFPRRFKIMSENKEQKRSDTQRYQVLGISIGMILGGALGFAIWMLTGMFVFLPVFIGAGLASGLAVGMGLDERQKDDNKNHH